MRKLRVHCVPSFCFEASGKPPLTSQLNYPHANIYDIPLTTLSGSPATLADYKGKVLLLVNVASKCGLTPQYTALEALYQLYKDKGLVILGFPSNDFAGQEPGTNEEIATFCSTEYPVTFPLFSKIPVVGPDKHPLYAELIAEQATAVLYGPWREGLEKYSAPTASLPQTLNPRFSGTSKNSSSTAAAKSPPASPPTCHQTTPTSPQPSTKLSPRPIRFKVRF